MKNDNTQLTFTLTPFGMALSQAVRDGCRPPFKPAPMSLPEDQEKKRPTEQRLAVGDIDVCSSDDDKWFKIGFDPRVVGEASDERELPQWLGVMCFIETQKNHFFVQSGCGDYVAYDPYNPPPVSEWR